MISGKTKSVILTSSCHKLSVFSSLPIFIGYIIGYIFLPSYIYFFPALFLQPMHFILVFIGFVFGVVCSRLGLFFFFCWINVSRSSHCKLNTSSSSSSCFFFHFFFLFILWALLQLLFSKIIAVAMGS